MVTTEIHIEMRKRPPEISDGLCFIEEYQTTPYAALYSHCTSR